jgi:hypothetical protein
MQTLLTRKKEFVPGEYIVTKDGHRGYVIEKVADNNMYQIRLTSGYTIRSGQDIKHDSLMDDVE